MVTHQQTEKQWRLDEFGFLQQIRGKLDALVSSVEQETEDGGKETHERDDSGESGPETVERIEDSTPEEWDLPENTEYTEYVLGPTVWERRP